MGRREVATGEHLLRNPFPHCHTRSHQQEKQFAKEEHVKDYHVKSKHSDQPDHMYFCGP